MGLAASQARLLTITSRKSDCEFQNMRYSHQKIALSRSMADISNEYQNSLNKTKLVYDFYGNGDQTNPVTYGLLMSPSELNGYMPMLTTSTDGRVVLNSAYAAAARAAGIPQEGLGCLPSEVMRNSFYDGLLGSQIITQNVADLCKSTAYSQDIGMGATDLIAKQVETKSIKEMIETLSQFTMVDFNSADGYTCTNVLTNKNESTATLADIWNGNYVLHIVNGCDTNHDADLSSLYKMDDLKNWSGWDVMFDAIDQALDTGDPIVKTAISGARKKINQILYGAANKEDARYKSTHGNGDGCGDSHTGGYAYDKVPENQGYSGTIIANGFDRVSDNTYTPLKAVKQLIDGFGAWQEWNGYTGAGKNSEINVEAVTNKLKDNASDYIGYYGYRVNLQMGSYYDDRETSDSNGGRTGGGLAIDVSNILKTYVTYIYQGLSAMNNRYSIDESAVVVEDLGNYRGTGSINHTVIITGGGTDGYVGVNGEDLKTTGDGTSRSVYRSNFVSDLCEFEMVIPNSTGMNTEGTLYSGHYDALFNQIASRGWTENNNVNDKDYLKEMYQNGLMFLTTCGDDGYYYQGDYSIHSFVKEVTDEEAIARAEAKYNTEKQRLTNKEQIIDLKMRNLDTEISALTTEYDTVKSVISKNIERGFKRYDA